MKIAFYGTKAYDKIWFEPLGKNPIPEIFDRIFHTFEKSLGSSADRAAYGLADRFIRMIYDIRPIFIIKLFRLTDQILAIQPHSP